MKGILISTILLLCFCLAGFSQGVRISTDNLDPDNSAMLDVVSTSKGLLIPRMTGAQRTSIGSPATGLLVFQTDGTSGFYYFNGTWIFLSQPGGTAGGDLTGSYPNPAIATGAVNSAKISDGSITNTDISNTAAISNTKITGLGSLSTLNSVSGGAGGTITDGTLVNVDISNSAAIAGTKVSPNFGSQQILTTGGIGVGTASPVRFAEIFSPTFVLARLSSGSGSGALLELNSASATNDWFIGSWGTSFRMGNTVNDFASYQDQFLWSETEFRPWANNTKTLGSASVRWSTVFAVNGTINTSDIRLKSDISDLQYGLESINQLRPVKFLWNDQSSDVYKIGLIAQEVKEVIPEVVDGNADSEMLGIYYSDLVPVLINAIQEQSDQIEKLTKKLDQLDKQLNGSKVEKSVN